MIWYKMMTLYSLFLFFLWGGRQKKGCTSGVEALRCGSRGTHADFVLCGLDRRFCAALCVT